MVTKLKDIVDEIQEIKETYDNEKGKPDIFREVIKFTTVFQQAIQEWQNPLNNISNICELHCNRVPILSSLQRNKCQFKSRMEAELRNAQSVFNAYKPQQIHLFITLCRPLLKQLLEEGVLEAIELD